jgi:hypothetical protein
MSVRKDQDAELAALKEEAVELGIQFHTNIGKEKLQDKIDEAINQRANEASAKRKQAKTKDGGVKLNRIQLMRMKASNLRKVRIVNMARENQGSKTVFGSCHNMYIDMARVLPLDTVIAVEEAILESISMYRQTMDEPVLDKNGNETGNYKSVEKPMYQIIYLDK